MKLGTDSPRRTEIVGLVVSRLAARGRVGIGRSGGSGIARSASFTVGGTVVTLTVVACTTALLTAGRVAVTLIPGPVPVHATTIAFITVSSIVGTLIAVPTPVIATIVPAVVPAIIAISAVVSAIVTPVVATIPVGVVPRTTTIATATAAIIVAIVKSAATRIYARSMRMVSCEAGLRILAHTSLGGPEVLPGGGGPGPGASGLLDAESAALELLALETFLGRIGLV